MADDEDLKVAIHLESSTDGSVFTFTTDHASVTATFDFTDEGMSEVIGLAYGLPQLFHQALNEANGKLDDDDNG